MNLSRLLTAEKLIREDLQLNSWNKVYYVETESDLKVVKEFMTPECFVTAMNPNVKGLATNDKCCFIFLFRLKGVTASIDQEFVLGHELRHLWQFQTGYEFDSNFMPYEWKKEEKDANDYSRARMANQLKWLKVGATVAQVVVGLGLGLLIKKAVNKKK